MSEDVTQSVPFVGTVFHPSDFSEVSNHAFAHALAIALLRQTKLSILHGGSGHVADDEWSRFPAVRATLERWGLLEPGSPRSAIFQEFNVRVEKVSLASLTPMAAIEKFVQKEEPDLMVLGTEPHEGLPVWLRPSFAGKLARRTRTMSLFVPCPGRGFVDPENGRISLRRILIPVDESPDATVGIVRATRAAEVLGDHPVAITLLHIGDGEPPALDLPEGEAWQFEHAKRDGDVVEQILAAARETDADLIVMATQGRQGVLDAMRGSVTERVLRGAPCPLLAVPEA